MNRIKVFIIDEAHMLTREAFNAFLKTLEEPPDNVVFILATTDREALPLTVLSRCQQFSFSAIPEAQIDTTVALIAISEDIPITNETKASIAQLADGSLRDALSILDQIRYIKKELTANDLESLLGIAPKAKINSLIASIAGEDWAQIFSKIEEFQKEGVDLKRVAGTLLGQLRNLLVCKVSPDTFKSLPSEKYERMLELTKKMESLYIINLIVNINAVYSTMQYGTDLKIALETAILKSYSES
jgi:DNA polymerase-3 subunit gamma/tau